MAFKIGLLLAALALATTVSGRRLPKYRPFTHNRIVGGENVRVEDFPYIVSFQATDNNPPFHFCAASLYKTNWVITASHCVDGENLDNPRNLQIAAGKTLYANDETDIQQIAIEKIVMHEGYGDGARFANDIAVMKLETDVELTEKVKLVQMPKKEDQESNWDGFNTVSGWGRTSAGGSNPSQLMAVEVPFVDDNTCRRAYGSDITDSMICTGEEGKDSCQGDSGGPMVSTKSTPHTQTGVVSWGYGCAQAGYPGVYTEVAYYVDWLEKNTQ